MTKRKRSPCVVESDEDSDCIDVYASAIDGLAKSEGERYVEYVRRRIERMKDKLNTLEGQVDKMSSIGDTLEKSWRKIFYIYIDLCSTIPSIKIRLTE